MKRILKVNLLLQNVSLKSKIEELMNLCLPGCLEHFLKTSFAIVRASLFNSTIVHLAPQSEKQIVLWPVPAPKSIKLVFENIFGGNFKHSL